MCEKEDAGQEGWWLQLATPLVGVHEDDFGSGRDGGQTTQGPLQCNSLSNLSVNTRRTLARIPPTNRAC